MPPPQRIQPHENLLCRTVYDETIYRCGDSNLSMSDMIYATMEGLAALDAAGYDIVDRRTGKAIPFTRGCQGPCCEEDRS
jgi:hypothetical protein